MFMMQRLHCDLSSGTSESYSNINNSAAHCGAQCCTENSFFSLFLPIDSSVFICLLLDCFTPPFCFYPLPQFCLFSVRFPLPVLRTCRASHFILHSLVLIFLMSPTSSLLNLRYCSAHTYGTKLTQIHFFNCLSAVADVIEIYFAQIIHEC